MAACRIYFACCVVYISKNKLTMKLQNIYAIVVVFLYTQNKNQTIGTCFWNLKGFKKYKFIVNANTLI